MTRHLGSPGPPPEVTRLLCERYAGTLESVPLARNAVVKAVEPYCDEGGLITAALLTSELAANAVVHTGGSFMVEVVTSGGILHVAVLDRSADLPRLLVAEPGAMHGRGIALVDNLAADWGAAATGLEKVVWFDLACAFSPT